MPNDAEPLSSKNPNEESPTAREEVEQEEGFFCRQPIEEIDFEIPELPRFGYTSVLTHWGLRVSSIQTILEFFQVCSEEFERYGGNLALSRRFEDLIFIDSWGKVYQIRGGCNLSLGSLDDFVPPNPLDFRCNEETEMMDEYKLCDIVKDKTNPLRDAAIDEQLLRMRIRRYNRFIYHHSQTGKALSREC